MDFQTSIHVVEVAELELHAATWRRFKKYTLE